MSAAPAPEPALDASFTPLAAEATDEARRDTLLCDLDEIFKAGAPR